MKTTTTLKLLDVRGFTFYEEQMDCFWRGWWKTGPSRILVGRLDKGATDSFVHAMQHRIAPTAIRRLSMFLGGVGSTDGEVAGNLLIGSPLKVLNIPIHDESFASEFFPTLAAHASATRLQNLSIADIGSVTALSALTDCLPKLVYLEELTIQYLFVGDHSAFQILSAMRQNGSLCNLSIDRHGNTNTGSCLQGKAGDPLMQLHDDW